MAVLISLRCTDRPRGRPTKSAQQAGKFQRKRPRESTNAAAMRPGIDPAFE
jgi:hypothetical protein